ncbi:hypothetical protein HDE68_002817 [Pedobacter cryoconitis]|uniref:Uncharacterized protein n=1 Tax=Pedobacter cryoconitis TaxID=188932 RepID=A0A7W8ZMU4_9SPHI|nr:hypothetical protein [Pedobacter cryoconitis]MBB5636904.1 hypothetical protein [Pedobacter cryoconitis]
MNKLYTLFFIAILNCVPVYAHTFADNEVLKKLFFREYEKFKPLQEGFKFTMGDLIFSSQNTHLANNNHDIVVNLAQISKNLIGKSDSFRSLFIKYIIAHELGHQIQFGTYQKNVINKASGEGRVFLECYADVLSGFIISQVYSQVELKELVQRPGFNQEAYFKENTTLILDVLTMVLEMNRKEVAYQTHPSNSQRLQAIRQGLLMGQTFLTHLMIFTNNPAYLALTKEKQEEIKTRLAARDKTLGYDISQSNNPFTWCHNEAILIINETNSLAVNVIRYDENIEWDKRATNPIVDFCYRLLNRNPVTVKLSGRNYTEIILRKDSRNILNLGTCDAATFDKTLAPGESVLISGRLKWIADDDYMPHIILPGDPRSVYWIFAAENPMPDQQAFQNTNADFDVWNQLTLDNIIDHISYVIHIQGKLSENIKGIGRSGRVSADEINKHLIIYEPKFKASHDPDQEIWIFPDQPARDLYQFKVFSSLDKDVCEKHYSEIVNTIDTEIKSLKKGSPIDSDISRFITFRGKNGSFVRVNLDYGTKKIENKITIQVHKENTIEN